MLVSRFIERSQRFRRAGAIVGILGMICSLIVVAAGGDEGIELNLTLFASIGLAGSIGGSVLAEGFRMRRSGPRIVSLEVRDPDVYRDRIADQRERVLLVLAALGVVGAVITGQHFVRVIALGVVVAVLALVRPWVMQRIAVRSRPVVPAEVAAADDEVRRMASSAGISRPMVTLGALVVSAQWYAVFSSGTVSDSSPAVVSWLALLGSIVLFLTACRWWWTNRSFGLSQPQLQAAGGSHSHLGGWVLGIVAVLVVMMALLVLARSMG